MTTPRILVFSTLFPSPAQPTAGVFIRERMFRVARRLPLVVVSPRPWFPLQGLIRRFRPHFRVPAPGFELHQGVEIHRPRFLSVPGLFRGLDSLSMALASFRLLRRLQRAERFNLIDAHFAYPDGHAATLLGRWLSVPVSITLRGTEVPLSRTRWRRDLMARGLRDADHVFSVSDSLRRHVGQLGIDPARVEVVGNGVDNDRFHPVPRDEARKALDLPAAAPVLISVGGLVERKGFHRVIECLPALRDAYPGLQYLIVGGPGPEGDWSERLRALVAEHGLQDTVRFLGSIAPDKLKGPLSASDVFVLATRNEGWANVFLEAMACGLPVVTTDVGGNREVVCNDRLGTVVPFGDPGALQAALHDALGRDWDRAAIRAHARANDWEARVDALCAAFDEMLRARVAAASGITEGGVRGPC